MRRELVYSIFAREEERSRLFAEFIAMTMMTGSLELSRLFETAFGVSEFLTSWRNLGEDCVAKTLFAIYRDEDNFCAKIASFR